MRWWVVKFIDLKPKKDQVLSEEFDKKQLQDVIKKMYYINQVYKKLQKGDSKKSNGKKQEKMPSEESDELSDSVQLSDEEELKSFHHKWSLNKNVKMEEQIMEID